MDLVPEIDSTQDSDRKLWRRGRGIRRGGAPLATGLAVGAVAGAAIANNNQANQDNYYSNTYYGDRKLAPGLVTGRDIRLAPAGGIRHTRKLIIPVV